MKQWQIGLIFGGALALWCLYDILTGERSIMNYAGVVAGAVIVIGAFMLRSKELT
jgi:hypothetical protein